LHISIRWKISILLGTYKYSAGSLFSRTGYIRISLRQKELFYSMLLVLLPEADLR